MVRNLTILTSLFLVLSANADTAGNVWAELKAKRDSLAGAHQEFEVSRTYKLATENQASKRQLIIDLSTGRWRESFVSGSGNYIRIFNGSDLFSLEDGNDEEYVRVKRRPKDPDPAPAPYGTTDADWSKAVELGRQPCGLAGRNDLCVTLEVPLKPWARNNGDSMRKMVKGVERLVVHLDSGLLLTVRIVEAFENRNSSYQEDTIYTLKQMSYGTQADANLFRLPSREMREVKELSPWNAAKIRKELAGHPAPGLLLKDLQGQPVSLSAFKGKTVLLDFWTTWCPPCRADGPALDKLFLKYGKQDLMIVGVSVSEDRSIVEKFLKEHPHNFPVVLTSENEMPRPYQIGTFPTYIVIDRDGTVASAVEGDQGFSELRKLLKKAGLEID